MTEFKMADSVITLKEEDTDTDTDTDSDTDSDSDSETVEYEYPDNTTNINVNNIITYLAGFFVISAILFLLGSFIYDYIENKNAFLYFILFALFVFANIMVNNIYNT